MSFDPTFEADLQAVAEKDAAIYPAGFSVSVDVSSATPVTLTEKVCRWPTANRSLTTVF